MVTKHPHLFEKANIDSWLVNIGLLMTFTALFAGRFSIGRLAGGNWMAGRLGSVELWATLAALVVAAILIQKKTLRPAKPDKMTMAFGVLLITVYAILTVNVLTIGAPDIRLQGVLDHIILFLHLILIWVLVSSKERLDTFCSLGVLFSFVLGVIWLVAIIQLNKYGMKAPLFATMVKMRITLFRLEFLGFGSAVYLSIRAMNKKTRLIYLIFSVFFLFSSLTTLSGAAVIAAVGAIVYMLFCLIVLGKYRWVIVLLCIAAIVIPISMRANGRFIDTRIARKTDATVAIRDLMIGNKKIFNDRFRELLQEQVTYGDRRFDELDPEDQDLLEAYCKIRGIKIPEDSEYPWRVLWTGSLDVMVWDGSERLVMAQAALQDWRRDKAYGQGIGNYHFSNGIAYLREMAVYRYPHNIVLEMLAATGLVGAIPFALGIFLAFAAMQRITIVKPILLPFAGVSCHILLVAMFSGDYYDFRLFWIIAFLVMCMSKAAPLDKPA